jgi:hypothetical protein
MVGAKRTKIETGNNPASDTNQNSRPYVSALKYYIHDGTEAFRFQLIGELREADVKELSGCWETAKSTFGSRKLVLDLRAGKSGSWRWCGKALYAFPSPIFAQI